MRKVHRVARTGLATFLFAVLHLRHARAVTILVFPCCIWIFPQNSQPRPHQYRCKRSQRQERTKTYRDPHSLTIKTLAVHQK